VLREADIDTATQAKITALSIQGGSIRDIAAQTGVPRSCVQRGLAKPEIRAKIEAAATRIMDAALDDAVDTVSRLAKIGTTTNDKDWAKLGLDASKHVLSIPGISGTQPSTVINALININHAPEQAQELSGIQEFLAHQWRVQPVIDAQVIDQMDTQGTGIATSHTPTTDLDAIKMGDQPGVQVEDNQHDPA
jgi:hypothetical protein